MSGEAHVRQAQADLLRALMTPAESLHAEALPAGLQAQAGIEGGVARGLQVYRLNAQVLADKVLAQAFPRLRAALGELSFAAMAASFWRQYPPLRADLGEWGQVLPGFLAERGVELCWVDLARLEWAAHRIERAPDDAFDAASLSLMAELEPAEFTLQLRAGSELLTVDAAAWQCWQRGQARSNEASDIDAAPEPVSIWVWRPQWRAELMLLSAGEAAFMSALLQGLSLAAALDAAGPGTAESPGFDFAAWLQEALQLGCLVAARKLMPG